MNIFKKTLMSMAGLLIYTSSFIGAQDTPDQWTDDPGRNNVVMAKDLPDHLGDDNRLWHVKLPGRNFYNIITVKGDRVYCGLAANNLPEPEKGRSGLLVLDRETGKVIWQKAFESGSGYGLSIVPIIEDDRIYVQASTTAYSLDLDGNIIWTSNNIRQKYFNNAQHGTHGTGVIVGDYWYINTGQQSGSDDMENWEANSYEHPWHPNIVVLNKHTGELVATDDIVVGPHQHGNWSSLSTANVNGKDLVFWGDPYGYLHAVEAPGKFEEGKVSTLKEVWYCDANPKSYRYTEDGMLMPYAAYMGSYGPKDKGPCEIVSAPAYHDGLLYLTITRDKAYSSNKGGRRIGNGALVCIDPTGEGDVTETHKVWENLDVNRTFSTPSIYKDKVIVATHAGYVDGVDLKTGKSLWKQDIKYCQWNYFQAVGDDKIFVTNEKRDFFILEADQDGGQLYHTELPAMNNPQPGLSDGMLFVGSHKGITAYGGPEYMKTHEPMEEFEEEGFDPEKDDKGDH